MTQSHLNVGVTRTKGNNSSSFARMLFTHAYIFNWFGTGHCSFENENCGLKTDKNATLHWTVGSAQTRRESTGPSYDHTFNKDGKKRRH